MHEAAHREFPARPLRRRSLTAASMAAVTLAGALATSAPAAALAAPQPSLPSVRLAPVGAAPALPSGDRLAGAVSPTAEVTGSVALQLRNPAAVTAFIDAVSRPRSPAYHHYLARGEFARRFGPSTAAVAAVEGQLRADGLTVSGVSANHLLVGFSGTAAAAEAAFHTGLRRVALAGGGTGQATTSAVSLPASVAPDVLAVLGLNRLEREHSAGIIPVRGVPVTRGPGAVTPAVPGGPAPCAAATALRTSGALTLDQVAASYGLN